MQIECRTLLGGNLFTAHKQYVDGVDIYGYVKGNPANYSDPFGLVLITPGGKEVCAMLKAGYTVEELIALGLITAGTVIVCSDPPSIPRSIPRFSRPKIDIRHGKNPRNLPVPRRQCQDMRRCPAEVEAMINGLIFVTCKTPGLTCKGTDTRELRELKTAAASACLSARLAMKLVCYPFSIGKGDHSQAIQQAQNRLNDCLTKPTID